MGPLLAILRRLLRISVAVAVRALIGRAAGRRTGPWPWRRARSGSADGGVVIDVRPLGTLDRYSEGARRAVVDAAVLADGLGAPRVGTPHLLAALAGRDDAAGSLLRGQGVGPEQVRAALDRQLAADAPARHDPDGSGRVTPGLRTVLRAAGQAAEGRASDVVAPLDLLRALAEGGDAAYETTLGAIGPRAADLVRSSLG